MMIAVVACDHPPDDEQRTPDGRSNGAWLLVQPPLVLIPHDAPDSAIPLPEKDRWRRVGAYPNDDAPIREWRQVAVFDSARECEVAIQNGIVYGRAVDERARCVPPQALYPERDH
jgi:hypothetical protein